MAGTVATRYVVAVLVVVLLAAGCVFDTRGGPSPTLCDGLPADMGGCAENVPSFAGTTCIEVAEEWGRAVDRGVVAVMDGPAVVEDKQRSARITDVLVVSSVRAGTRLDELGLLPSCDVDVFLPAGRREFSNALVDGIGEVLFDGSPVASPEDWNVFLTRFIRIIDEGE